MLSHKDMVGLQADDHVIVSTDGFRSKEEYVLHLIHTGAYVRASKVAKGRKVLDLGCNAGYGSKILSESAKQVVGVDVSETAVATAQQLYGDCGIDFQRVDGEKLPFADDEFDMIVSCQVIEHVVDYEAYVGEIRRVLAPRGIVLFTTPNSILRLDPGMKPWNRFHVREFDHVSLGSLLGTFFPQVAVLGLFANEPLYSVERSRLARKREQARNQVKAAFRQRVRQLLPSPAVKGVAQCVRTVASLWKQDQGVADFMQQHGVDEFFYRQDELTDALDLLAMCSRDGETLRDCQKGLLPARQHAA